MREEIDTNSWRNALSSDLPGTEAQQRMAPSFRGAFHHSTEPVRAGVMILLYPAGGKIWVVFIKRNEYDGPHSAQVSFPGGASEESDRTIEHTAIRETREELGIGEKIEILGTLTPLHIPVSNFLVFPMVGWSGSRPRFHPDPAEVQYLLEIPVSDFLRPGSRDSETIHRDGKDIIAPYYKAGKDKIWGATAMILSEFLQLASTLLSHRC